ncbi:MAG: single-stranded DNA-binding protein [Mycobacteriales bacterium]
MRRRPSGYRHRLILELDIQEDTVPTRTRTAAQGETVDHRNDVALVGRFSGLDEARQLPSGDTVVGFRVVVDRPSRARRHGRAAIDTIDCQAVAATVRRAVTRLHIGDLVDVRGSLRRRFYRRPGGVASRYGVEATSVRPVRSG